MKKKITEEEMEMTTKYMKKSSMDSNRYTVIDDINLRAISRQKPFTNLSGKSVVQRIIMH
jgi:hypothetical protein